MKSRYLILLALSAIVSCSVEEQHEICLVTTGDVHGAWFPESYVTGETLPSLMAVSRYVGQLRDSVGKDNVILLDAGDCLQGDKAPYYFNYVETDVTHLFPRIASYMGYDVMTLGNHDIETGHAVYDRVCAELDSLGIPWLGGNAIREDNGKKYFPHCSILEKGGLKLCVLGYDNPNIKAWLSEELWSGMEFVSLIPLVQQDIDRARRRFHPDVVIVSVHSGSGEGNGEILESQGLDLLASLKGADVLVSAHDHRPLVAGDSSFVMVNSGAKAEFVGKVDISVRKKGHRVTSKSVSAEVVKMEKSLIDTSMFEAFSEDFGKVKSFTLRPVGRLKEPLRTRDAYVGMADYLNLLHTVQLSVPEAQISFAAPLTFNGTVEAGELVYNDMFTIYPFENQMVVMTLTGAEIRRYLECSYDAWIQTPGDHVLRIEEKPDPRTGSKRWSFVNPSYNFDSAAGLCYTVDVTRPSGERVNIISLADGSAFEETADYGVAMTSYRANGGGGLLEKGCGLDAASRDGRIAARYPEIRELVYRFVLDNPELTPMIMGNRQTLGEWRFVPESVAAPKLAADMRLLF